MSSKTTTTGTVSVNDSGAVLSYEDTGPPTSGAQTYLTVVLIHGSVFHGTTFRRLVPYAAQHNLRLILLNTRDYPGSTPYAPTELELMHGGDHAAQEAFMRAQGHEIALFLERFIRANKVPPLEEVERQGGNKIIGGVAVGAWSFGNIYHTALFAHLASLEDESCNFLERYLRTIVYLDASCPSVGIPAAEGVYHPLRDTSLSPKERGEVFLSWVSAYFTPVPSLSDVSPSLLAPRTFVPESDDVSSPRFPTVKRMSPAELASVTHFTALASNLALRQIDESVYAANLRRALFDTNAVCPRAKALVLWCDMSIGDCVWAAKGIADLLAAESANAGSKTKREVEFVKLEGCNHFVHWDDPEKLVRVLVEHA
ncbi:hypothetical protein EIP86_009163 [Pleurotus ostreatoroseus]|nr:hypothetical protein EIP86_009163 [Pleurotus ostreatoroseus]